MTGQPHWRDTVNYESDLWSQAHDCAIDELLVKGQSADVALRHPLFDMKVRQHYERLSRKVKSSEILTCVNDFPKRYRNATFDTYTCETDRVRRIVEFMKTGKSAVIYGPNGTGKTLLSFCAIRHQLEQGVSAAYLLAADFFDEIRKTFNSKDKDPADVLEKYAAFGYLVIDEVDKIHGSQTEFVYLYRLINRRYNDMRHTVVIGNSENKSDIADVIGNSAVTRIASEGTTIELSGKDWRKNA